MELRRGHIEKKNGSDGWLLKLLDTDVLCEYPGRQSRQMLRYYEKLVVDNYLVCW